MNPPVADDALERAARDVTRGAPAAMGALYDLLSADAYRLALMACDRPDMAARAVEQAFMHVRRLLRAEPGPRAAGDACPAAAELMALTHHAVLTSLLARPRRRESRAAGPGRKGAVGLRGWSGRPGLSTLQSCCVALGGLRLYTTGQIAEMLGTQDDVVKEAMTDGLRALAQR